MKRYQLFILFLAATILVAGCTSPSTEDDDGNETVEGRAADSTGEIVRTFSTDNPSIYVGNREQLSLILQNPRDRPLTGVQADIGNYGQLGIVRLVPGQGQQGIDDDQCQYQEIPADTGTDTEEYRCIWRLSAMDGIVGDARDQVTLPLTAFVTYRSALATSDSVRASFVRGRDIRPGDRQTETIRASNPELTLDLQHTSPVPAEEGEVPITLELADTGDGDVVGRDRTGMIGRNRFRSRSAVNLSFQGTLADARWNREETTCVDRPGGKWKTVELDEDTGRTTLSCTIVLDEPELVDRTYTLRAEARYRYRIVSETPLTVLKPE